MAEYAQRVAVDVESGGLSINGVPFPYFYRDAVPTVVEGPHGEPVPGLTLTVVCTDLQVISPGKVINDE